jgi:hypothetical protein
MRLKHLILLPLSLLFACGEEANPLPPKLFQYLSADETGVDFSNQINERIGRTIGAYDYMYNGAGVAIVDLNNDGLSDLVFCGNDVPSEIYQNLGGLKFQKVTGSGVEHKGWTTGITVVDINKDGLKDLYFSRSGPDHLSQKTSNLLYINQGDFEFKEESETRGIFHEGLSTQGLFFDVDNDQDLDLLQLNHAVRNWANSSAEWLNAERRIAPGEIAKYRSTLYLNDGEGHFEQANNQPAFDQTGFCLSAALSDFSGKGEPSLFIANDYFVPDQLLTINEQGNFTDQIQRKFNHTSFYSMGSDAADFNNDGLIDLVVPDMAPGDHYRSKTMMRAMDTTQFRFLERRGYVPQYMFNGCYLNSGDGVMSDIAHLAGVAQTDWSWAPLIADLNNDGLKDLYITNGVYRDVTNNDWRKPVLDALLKDSLSNQKYFDLLQNAPRTPLVNAAFQNTNGMLFEAVETTWGLDSTSFSNGLAMGDLDNDGDLDIVTNNLGQTAFVIRNTSADRGACFIRFKLTTPNHTDALIDGAKVQIWINGQQQLAENRFTRGYLSYSEPIIHFGLGENRRAEIDSLVIIWPNNERVMFPQLATNTTHEIQYAKGVVHPENASTTNYWDLTSLAFRSPVKHQENEFDDFKVEQLLPQKTSAMGPALAVGDVNGDDLPDFYLGGAKGKSGQLLIQNEGGFFNEKRVKAFSIQAAGEELGACFLDADADGDLDLYVARGGGGDVQQQTDLLQDLLYLNDGTGDFSLEMGSVPAIRTSTKAIAPFDWDDDGDVDLFIAGRNVPGMYPYGTRSYFLENRNGKFMDITGDFCPDFLNMQMITDACWTAKGVNDQPNLIVVGEWLKPQLYVLNGAADSEKKLAKSDVASFDNHEGWWNSVDCFTFHDQQIVVLGNMGLNNKFHVREAHPLHLAAGDFDGNKTTDILLIKNYKGTMVPVRGLQCSSEQIPEIKERFQTFDAFASADIFEIIGRDLTAEDLLLRANTFESGWMTINREGIGMFNVFPVEAQVSPVMGAVSMGNELILAGNLFTTEIETTSYDAGKGTVLTAATNAQGELGFTVMPPAISGVFLPDDVRQLLPMSISIDQLAGFIAASNDHKVKLYVTGE